MRNESQELSAKLNAAIDYSIREVMLRDKRADVDTVHIHLRGSNSMLLDKMQPDLAWAQERIRIQGRLKHVHVAAVPLKDAVERMRQDEEQPYLPEMEQFRHIPENISIRTGDGVFYIPYADTLKADRKMAELLLASGIEADQKLLDALKSGNEFADSLVEIYGDLPLHELVKLWLRDRKRKES